MQKCFCKTDFLLHEACFSVGFDSVSSFTGLFGRYTKLTPSGYQKKFDERREQLKKAPLQFIPNCFAQQKGWIQKKQF